MNIGPLVQAGFKPQKFDWVDLGLNSKGFKIKVKTRYYQWLAEDEIMRLHFLVERYFANGELDDKYIFVSEANNKNFVDYTGTLVSPLVYTEDTEDENTGLIHEAGELILDAEGKPTYQEDSMGEYDFIATLATQQVHIPDIINGYIPILFARGKFDKEIK